MKIEQMPRVNLASLPTPLEEMRNLTEHFNGPGLYIKRDDMTGLAFGGNKVRKLEFIMADAIKNEADIIITFGGVQTNHGRLTTAAARKLGLKPVLILTGEEPQDYKGNLLLDYLMGAEIHFVDADPELPTAEYRKQLEAKIEEKALEIKENYESQGHKCYVIPMGGRLPVATAGYVNAVLEIYNQLINMNKKIDYLVTAVGSTSTVSSLILGNRLFNTGIKVIGICVLGSAKECKDQIMDELKKDIEFYGYDIEINREEITLFDDYIGPGYSIPTREGMQAVKLLAEKEAIMLDYSYTGKAMAGLFDLIQKEYFTREDNVLFLHTGGNAALFSLGKKKFEEIIKD